MRTPKQYALPLAMAQHKCDACYDTGRYEETWGNTAGRSGRCPHGCPPRAVVRRTGGTRARHSTQAQTTVGGTAMTDNVQPNFKPERPAKVETANQRRGRINRQSGKRKQAAARRQLEHVFGPATQWHTHKANEEDWTTWPVRCEVKSGAQVGPIATRYLAAEKQAEQQRATGDVRPFFMVAMPKEWGTEGLVVVRLSTFRELLA
jgi:hypothetical protein